MPLADDFLGHEAWAGLKRSASGQDRTLLATVIATVVAHRGSRASNAPE